MMFCRGQRCLLYSIYYLLFGMGGQEAGLGINGVCANGGICSR